MPQMLTFLVGLAAGAALMGGWWWWINHKAKARAALASAGTAVKDVLKK